MDFKRSPLCSTGGGCHCRDGCPVPSPLPSWPFLAAAPFSLFISSPSHPHPTEEGGWDEGGSTGWPGQAEGWDQGPSPGQRRRLASPLRPSGPCIRLLPLARMTDGPPRKGHCLRSSCVFGGGGRAGVSSEPSLNPCLAFGGLDLASNRTLFWLLRMGRFRS